MSVFSKKNRKVFEEALKIEKDNAESLKIQTHLKLFSMTCYTDGAKRYLGIMLRKVLASL